MLACARVMSPAPALLALASSGATLQRGAVLDEHLAAFHSEVSLDEIDACLPRLHDALKRALQAD